jgi:hypothetical protein
MNQFDPTLILTWKTMINVAKNVPGIPLRLVRDMSDRIDELLAVPDSEFLEQVRAFEAVVDARRNLSRALFCSYDAVPVPVPVRPATLG